MRLRFMLARRIPDGPSAVVAAAAELLRRRGFDVATTIAEEEAADPARLGGEADLWLLKSYTPLSLSLAGALHRAGARLLNPYPASLAARDKIVAARVLRAAGIPSPRCWVTGHLPLLAPLARETPLVVKPHLGWRGEGVRVVRGEAELLALPPRASRSSCRSSCRGPAWTCASTSRASTCSRRASRSRRRASPSRGIR